MVNMENKIKISKSKILLFSIIVFSIICITASYMKDKNSVNVYGIESIEDDRVLELKNLSLVLLENNLYIKEGCTFNIKKDANFNDIKDIEAEVRIDKKQIIKANIKEVNNNTVNIIDMPTIIRNVRTAKDSLLEIEWSYKFKGEQINKKEDIELENCITEYALYK